MDRRNLGISVWRFWVDATLSDSFSRVAQVMQTFKEVLLSLKILLVCIA